MKLKVVRVAFPELKIGSRVRRNRGPETIGVIEDIRLVSGMYGLRDGRYRQHFRDGSLPAPVGMKYQAFVLWMPPRRSLVAKVPRRWHTWIDLARLEPIDGGYEE